MLNIAVSARIHHGTPEDIGVYRKDNYLIEHSVAHLLSRHGALVTTVPPLRNTQAFTQPESYTVSYDDYATHCDGLLMQGGADMAPESYGEAPRDPKWAGDAARDAYELALVDAFARAGKPILGICRGLQVLNVYFGGSLRQDIPDELGNLIAHRDLVHYERAFHDVQLVAGGTLATLYADAPHLSVNTIHHQCVKKLGAGLDIEATAPDGIIEAFRHQRLPILAVQWHPEFHDPAETSVLASAALMQYFLNQCIAAAAAPHGAA
jgi:putative glutamine amidotransferase